jgi:hypothetical protein
MVVVVVMVVMVVVVVMVVLVVGLSGFQCCLGSEITKTDYCLTRLITAIDH